MSVERDRQRDVRQIMTGVAELREDVAIHAAPIGLWRGLLSLFLVLRLGLAFLTVLFPQGGIVDESHNHLALAHKFANDGQYGLQESSQADMMSPPGYVVFLAGLELVFGTDLHWVTLVQLLFSGLTSLVLLRLGIELQRPRAGLVAAWFYALSPNVMLWSLTITTEVCFAMLLALTTLLIVRAVNGYRRWWPRASGLALAGMAYIRPIALALVPLWSGIVYWFRQARYGKFRALVAALFLALLAALTVLPWAYGNWLGYDEFAFSTAPRSAWVGSNLAEVIARAEGISPDQALESLAPDRGSLDLTLEVVSRHPVEFVEAQLLGIARTLVGSDIGALGKVLGADSLLGRLLLSGATPNRPDKILEALIRGEDATLGVRLLFNTISLVFSLALLLPAAFGALFVRAESDAGRLCRAIAVSNAFVLLVLPGAAGQARFRIPAEPYLALLAGLGVSYVVDQGILWWRRRRGRGRSPARSRR